jgi:hypothetical protein
MRLRKQGVNAIRHRLSVASCLRPPRDYFSRLTESDLGFRSLLLSVKRTFKTFQSP